MNRRPWPIVLLAILQFLSPLIYFGVASLFYGLSFMETAREILSLAEDLRKFELIGLPIILGILILVTRRFGYIVVIVGSLYLMVRSIIEFLATNQTDPLFPVVISNLICIAILIYFLRAKTREVYFNPRLRWWETDPRYVVNLKATITRIGAEAQTAKLENIAYGGAGIVTSVKGFLPDEVVELAFEAEGTRYTMKTRIVWQRPESNDTFLGTQWEQIEGNEYSKLRRYVRSLKEKGTPTTRKIPPWWEDLKTWLTGKSA